MKGLEAFENIRTQIRYPKGKRPERSKEELLSDLNIVEKELKALEIIKKYLMFGFHGLLEDDTYLCFAESDDEYMSFRIKDKKEYELLKGVLDNGK